MEHMLKIFISQNLLYCFFQISFIRLMVGTTSSPNLALIPSWISSFDSSGSKGFPSWLNSFVVEDTCFANFSWKDLESSWWLNSECSFSFSMDESQCETALASSVKPRITPFPRKKKRISSKAFLYKEHTLISSISESISFRKFLTFKNEYTRKLIPFSKTDIIRYSVFPKRCCICCIL